MHLLPKPSVLSVNLTSSSRISHTGAGSILATGNGGCRLYARLRSPALQDAGFPFKLYATNQSDGFRLTVYCTGNRCAWSGHLRMPRFLFGQHIEHHLLRIKQVKRIGAPQFTFMVYAPVTTCCFASQRDTAVSVSISVLFYTVGLKIITSMVTMTPVSVPDPYRRQRLIHRNNHRCAAPL